MRTIVSNGSEKFGFDKGLFGRGAYILDNTTVLAPMLELPVMISK